MPVRSLRRIVSQLVFVVLATLAGSVLAPLSAQEPSVAPAPPDLQRVLEEVQSLRRELQQKELAIEDLRRRTRELEAQQAARVAAQQDAVPKMELELELLRKRLDEMTPLAHAPPPYPKLSFGGQVRWRAESRNGYDFGSGNTVPSDHFVEQRARFHVDAEFSTDLRALVQIQDTRRWGEETSTTDRSADGMDLHQGLLDVKHLLSEKDLLRIGRQEIAYGSQRLVAIGEWANQARSFDALRWMDDTAAVHTEVVASKLHPTRDATSGDYTASEWGAIQTTLQPFEAAKKSALDLYAIYLHDAQRYQEQSRWTTGSRFEHLSQSGLYLEAEGALQFGQATTGTTGAPQVDQDLPFGEVFAYVLRAGWRFDETAWKPGFTFELNHATGDRDPDDGENQRFNSLFSLAHAHNGMIDLTFWENTRNVALRLNASPSTDLDLFLDGWAFWVDRETDAVRGPSFSIPGLAGSRKFVGTEVDALARWRPRPGLSIEAGYAALFPGGHVQDVLGDDEMAQFVYLMVGLKF